MFRFLFLAVLSLPLLALAQVVPTTPDGLEGELGGLAELTLKAILSGQWGLVVSLVILALVVVARPHLAKKWPAVLTPKGLTVTAILVAFVGGVANALLAGGIPSVVLLATILIKAVSLGLASAGAAFATQRKQVDVKAAEDAGRAAALAAANKAPTFESIGNGS